MFLLLPSYLKCILEIQCSFNFLHFQKKNPNQTKTKPKTSHIRLHIPISDLLVFLIFVNSCFNNTGCEKPIKDMSDKVPVVPTGSRVWQCSFTQGFLIEELCCLTAV